MKINGVKKIEQKVFKNSKGDLLKFVSNSKTFPEPDPDAQNLLFNTF